MGEASHDGQKDSSPARNGGGESSRLSPGKFSLFAFSEKLGSSRFWTRVVILLLPVLIFIRYPLDPVDADMWWHMALGKYYVTHHTLVMDHSVFSWTPTDPTWIYNTCLGSIAIYLFYTLAGGFGLWLFQWLVFLGVFVSFYLFLRLLNQRLDITGATIIALIGVACSITCRYYKPELFSVLLFAWLAFVYFYVKVTRNGKYFYFFPLIFLLWVNFHGAFVIGLVFMGVVFGGEVLNRLFFPKESLTTRELVHFFIAVVLSGGALFANPYGADYLISTYQGITSAQYAGLQNKYVLAWAGLWHYLKAADISFFKPGLSAWIMTVMIMLILALSVFATVKKRFVDFALILVSIIFYWKAMETARTVYFFCIAFFFIFFYLLVYKLQRQDVLKTAALFSLAVFIFFFFGVSYFNIRYGAENKWFGSGLHGNVPFEEVEFVKKSKIPGLIFNDDITGAYLMWALYPEYKVFLDSRSSPYRKGVFPDYMEFVLNRQTKESIEMFRKKYPFSIAIIHYRHMPLIVDFLSTGGDWNLLFFDKRAAVLIHKSLLPLVQAQIRKTNFSPARFNRVKNPEVLFNVFNFYVRMNPEAGRYIFNIYKRNVSDFYKPKEQYLQFMEATMKNTEQELKEQTFF